MSTVGPEESDYIDTNLASMTTNWRDVCESGYLNACVVNRCFVANYKMISPFARGSLLSSTTLRN